VLTQEAVVRRRVRRDLELRRLFHDIFVNHPTLHEIHEGAVIAALPGSSGTLGRWCGRLGCCANCASITRVIRRASRRLRGWYAATLS
jgi:hypothetical protein